MELDVETVNAETTNHSSVFGSLASFLAQLNLHVGHVEKCNPDVSIPRHRILRAKNPKTRNPKLSNPERRNSRHARENISKSKVQGDEMEKPKAEKLRGEMSANLQVVSETRKPRDKLPRSMLTRQRTSVRSIPNRCARSNNLRSMMPSTKKDSKKEKSSYCTFEVGECSETKDDSRRVIEKKEAEDFEIGSEHEMLRKMKMKPNSKEKCYRDKMCSEHQTKRVLGKKDDKNKLQAAQTAIEEKPKL